jgi:acyl-CoA hydrolase
MRSSTGPVLFDDPDQLADAVIARAGKNIVLGLPLGLGKANHVANAMFARAIADCSISLCIFTGLTLEKPRGKSELERRFLEPLSRRLFDGYPDLAYALALHAGTLPPNIQVDEFFFQAGSRLDVPVSQRSHICANYTHVLGYLIERGVNVIGQLVAKRVHNGEARFSLSCNPDITLDLLARRRQGQANFLLIGQVNSELPFMPGDADLPASEFDLLLDSPKVDFPLFGPPRQPIELAHYAAGLHAARCVADAGTLQLGIGSLGDAVVQGLILRHRHNAEFRRMIVALSPGEKAAAAFFDDAPFAQGLHGMSEMLVEGFLALRQAGILTREVDGSVLAAAFFLGSRDFYRALREMPVAELAKLRMAAVSFINEIYCDEPAKRAARVKARFINDAMMATLLGDVISDALEDGSIVSGVGGQYNFVAQAFALDGARSIIMLPATRTIGGGITSNIRWSYGHVTIPRHLRDIVITEYGIADLRGKPERRVIAAMLEISDSRFQQKLLARAKAAGKIEREYELPVRCRENAPERIESALRPFREQGLLPRFPFGTDFTAEEQRLLPALSLLRASSRRRLAQLALRGFLAQAESAEVQRALARMGLDKTSRLRDRFYAHVLRGALAAVAEHV